MKTYPRYEDYGQVRGRYGLKGEEAILMDNTFLKLFLGTEGGAKKISDINKYINEQTGTNSKSSNIYSSLEQLEKAGLIKVVSCTERKRTKPNGKTKIVRSRIRYAIDYAGVSDFFLNKAFFQQLDTHGVNAYSKKLVCKEMMKIFPVLIYRYLANIKKYYDLQHQSLKTKFDIKNKGLQPDDKVKLYLRQVDKIFVKLLVKEAKDKDAEEKDARIMSLAHKDYSLIDLVEGFLRYLQQRPDVLHKTLIQWYKQNNKKYTYKQKRSIDTFVSMIDIYFARNRCEVLAKIQEYYGDKYFEELKKGRVSFDSP